MNDCACLENRYNQQISFKDPQVALLIVFHDLSASQMNSSCFFDGRNALTCHYRCRSYWDGCIRFHALWQALQQRSGHFEVEEEHSICWLLSDHLCSSISQWIDKGDRRCDQRGRLHHRMPFRHASITEVVLTRSSTESTETLVHDLIMKGASQGFQTPRTSMSSSFALNCLYFASTTIFASKKSNICHR